MAHHHAPNHPLDKGKESGEFKLGSSDTATHNLSHSSLEAKKETENRPPHEKRKSIFDSQIAGFPWPFVAVMSVIAIAVLGMILKLMGVF